MLRSFLVLGVLSAPAPDWQEAAPMVGRQALRSEASVVSKDSLNTWRVSPRGPGKQITWVYLWDLVRMGLWQNPGQWLQFKAGLEIQRQDFLGQARFPICSVSVGTHQVN